MLLLKKSDTAWFIQKQSFKLRCRNDKFFVEDYTGGIHKIIHFFLGR